MTEDEYDDKRIDEKSNEVKTNDVPIQVEDRDDNGVKGDTRIVKHPSNVVSQLSIQNTDEKSDKVESSLSWILLGGKRVQCPFCFTIFDNGNILEGKDDSNIIGSNDLVPSYNEFDFNKTYDISKRKNEIIHSIP